MAFVPTPHVPVESNVSPRARDLARNLEKAVEEFRSRNPTLSDQEIRQALLLMNRSRAPVAAGLLAGLLAAGLAVGGVVAYLATGQGRETASVQWVAITIGGIAALLGLLVAVRRGRG